MRERNTVLIFVLLFSFISAILVSAKPVDVLLKPAEYGKPSKIMPILDNKSALLEVIPVRKKMVDQKLEIGNFRSYDMVLAYDNGSAAAYLSGLSVGYHIGVWFQSPAACTLLQVYFYFYNGGDVTYYVSDPSDTIDFLNDYEEYHSGVNPGPSPIESYLHPEESRTAPNGWDTLVITAMPDVAKNVFYAAYIMDDSSSMPIIDAGISPPYHTIMQRHGGGGGPFGWYSSWHHVYIRALVRIYETLLRDLTQYSTTASPGPYPVDVTVVNFADSLLYVNLIITANGVGDTIPMNPVKADTTVYTANIPAYSQTTDILYHVEALDSDSNFASSDTYEFWFFAPSGVILYVNESWDPVLDYVDVFDSLGIIGGFDVYEPSIYGIPDSTVLPVYNAVIWNGDWGYGTILTKESAGNVLYDYMVNGGNIFFNSDEILGFWDGWANVNYYPGEFPYDVLKVDHIYNDICYDFVYGVPGDTISSGINTGMTFPLSNWNDEVEILDSADSIFTDASGSDIRGVKWEDANNKVVFIPFMYVSLPKSTQIAVMRNVLTWFGIQTGISSDEKGDENIPRVFALSQNRPNPFNKRTTICYSIPRKTNVTLRIYNAAGQLVRTLVNGIEKPGYKNVIWNGLDRNNKRVAQGIYFYRLTAGSFKSTKKVLVLR